MKTIVYATSAALLLAGWSSCHEQERVGDEGKIYTVHAAFDVDSTVVLDHMVLYADSHLALHEDSLFLSPEGMLDIERSTPGLDEVYLCSDYGELCRFYATGGMAVSLSLSGRQDSLVVCFDETVSDSINPWIRQQHLSMEQCPRPERKTLMDSLCHQLSSDVRCALLLREELQNLDDSVFVRKCLGALRPEAKPDWLVKSIDDLLVATSSAMSRNRRLKGSKFAVNDSTTFDMAATRSDYLLIYCWADYDEASIDSLKMLDRLIDDDFYMKRLKVMTCCLNAKDSASWRAAVKDIDATHVWLPAGLSDLRVRNWYVDRVPALLLCDMYNNLQQRNVWGKTLRDALDRVPNRSGFAHTPKTKPHGR